MHTDQLAVVTYVFSVSPNALYLNTDILGTLLASPNSLVASEKDLLIGCRLKHFSYFMSPFILVGLSAHLLVVAYVLR